MVIFSESPEWATFDIDIDSTLNERHKRSLLYPGPRTSTIHDLELQRQEKFLVFETSPWVFRNTSN